MIISSLQTDGSFRYRLSLKIRKPAASLFYNLDGMSQANGCGDVQLENDNLSVINCHINERPPPQWYAAKYYVDVMHASRDMDWLEVRWIPRKLNKADGLFRL